MAAIRGNLAASTPISDDLRENSQLGKIPEDLGEHWNDKGVAYAVAVQHPEMSVRQVAAEAGCSRGTAATAVASNKSDSLPKKLDTIADESAATGLSAATVARQRRLKADHPELWAEVKAGTKSTHAAAIAAGIVKVPSVPPRSKHDRIAHEHGGSGAFRWGFSSVAPMRAGSWGLSAIPMMVMLIKSRPCGRGAGDRGRRPLRWTSPQAKGRLNRPSFG